MNINVCERHFLITKYNIGHHNYSYHARPYYSYCLLEKDQLMETREFLSGETAYAAKI